MSLIVELDDDYPLEGATEQQVGLCLAYLAEKELTVVLFPG